jgi:superfamily II DNA or RNA helicase
VKELLNITSGTRISVRGEEFLINDIKANYDGSKILFVEGISELVKGRKFAFDSSLEEDINLVDPANTELRVDTQEGYRTTKLLIETNVRNSFLNSKKIEIAHKAAFNPAEFQYTPTLKALSLPRPRILIADGVGLGKTIEVGIFLAEMIKRGQGQRIMVLAMKSILGQFQQEIWNRFAIPLVRLDSLGIARIKAELPANKNPFDYYDKTIISVDTLKNNAKFRHYIEKSHWDVIVIDECHTVANIHSLRGNLAQYLSTKCECLVLTSATPHNGKKESFANLIQMIEPTAIPKHGNYTKDDVQKYFVRRFKKDIEDQVGENFSDREVIRKTCKLNPAEEDFLKLQQTLKFEALRYLEKTDAYQQALIGEENPVTKHDLLFSIGLFKSYLSSPEACLETVMNRKAKILSSNIHSELKKDSLDVLDSAKNKLETVINLKSDAKYSKLIEILHDINWKGRASDERIIIFSERIKTLTSLNEKLTSEFSLKKEAVVYFHGGLTDIDQQNIIEDFGKEDSSVRLFLTSDAGSMGVNLHFYCNIIINYDIPWSIITLDQRNGRIDRFGQKKTPYIYYLIAHSELEGLRTDLHIINKITEKEEQVYKTLGDAGAVFRLYDANKEEEKIKQAIAKSDEGIFDNVDDFDYTSILFDGDSDTTEAIVDDNPVMKSTSFYKNDFDFYSSLSHFLVSNKSIKANQITIEEDLIQLVNDKELNELLYDLPSEAKPSLGKPYSLTTNTDVVQKSIASARKKKGDWARFQLMYDVHPIVKVLMNKLIAHIDKNVALVTKTSRVPNNSIHYIFHGQVANNLGQSVLSDFFVVSLNRNGSLISKPIPLDDFIIQNKLNELLYNQTATDEELEALKNNLKDAVSYAYNMYMDDRQALVQDEMLRKADEYEAQVIKWHKQSENQINLKYETDTINIFVKNAKERNLKEIQTILDEKSQYFKNMSSLDQKAFLRLLAVFYN